MDKQNELNVFASRVEKPAAGVLPPSKQISKVDLLAVMSHQGQEQIKVNIDCPKFKGDESDRLEFKNWYERIDVIVKSHPKWSYEYKLFFIKRTRSLGMLLHSLLTLTQVLMHMITVLQS